MTTRMDADKSLALVTGTSSGIGAAIAGALLGNGWHVIGLSRRDVSFDNPRYRHIAVDLSSVKDLTDAADRMIAPILAGRPWLRVGLVNNAGTSGGLCPLEAMAAEDIATVFAINAVAPMFLMGFVVRVAPPASTLRIVNLSSGAATRPVPGLADYGSSKAALRLAGMTLAAELASPERPGGPRPNVAILSYSPGVVDTAMQERARAHRPWNEPFVDFHAHGQLKPPDVPALEVVDFLGGNGGDPISETRSPIAPGRGS